jgi:hypothetical protein
LVIATNRRLTALFDVPRSFAGSASGSKERSYLCVETRGAILVVAPLKIAGGSGAPARLFAERP